MSNISFGVLKSLFLRGAASLITITLARLVACTQAVLVTRLGISVSSRYSVALTDSQ